MLNKRFMQIKYGIKDICLILFFALLGSLFSGCNGGSESSAVENQNFTSQLLIDNATTIPVINGVPTHSGVYIHNLGKSVLNNIHYKVINNNQSYLVTIDGENNCTTLQAKSSCLVKFTIPALTLGDNGSFMLIAEYNEKRHKQLLNYEYVTADNYKGLTFSNPSIRLNRGQQYITTYAFNPVADVAYTGKLKFDNDNLEITRGTNNTQLNLQAHEIVPIEFKVGDVLYSRRSRLYDDNSINRALLQAIITPQATAHLLVANPGILKLAESDTRQLVIYNNGSQSASQLSLVADNANKVAISPGVDNPCVSGMILAPGASCDYQVQVLDHQSDVQTLSFTYNNGTETVTETRELGYIASTNFSSLQIKPEVASLSLDAGESYEVKFIVNNIGNAALNNAQPVIRGLMPYSSTSIIGADSSCTDTIGAKSSCQITVKVDTIAERNESGILYLALNGNSGQSPSTSLNFASLPLRIEVTDRTQLQLTDFRPLDEATDVLINTDIELFFNKAVNPVTINSPNIVLKTDSGDVVTFQSVQELSDRHMQLTPSTLLTSQTHYSIVINQQAVTDLNGKVLGSDSAYTAGSFTTGGSIAPYITQVNPENNQSNVSRKPDIYLLFSESMAASGINSGSIKLLDANGGVQAVTPVGESDNKLVRLVFDSGNPGLAQLTAYRIIVDETQLKDLAGNPMGSIQDKEVSHFTTGDFTAPDISLATLVTGCGKGDGSISSTCYDNTNPTGGNAQNLKLKLTFTNNDTEGSADKIELSQNASQLLATDGFILSSNDCEQQLPPGSNCSMVYSIPFNLINTPGSRTKNQSVNYRVTYDNNYESQENTANLQYSIQIVNPTIDIVDFLVQIKDTNKVVEVNFNNLYNANLVPANLTSSVAGSSISCDVYDSASNSQKCNVTLAPVATAGTNKTLTVNAWGGIVSDSQIYEVARLIFVSNEAYTGDLGGASGANGKCNSSTNGKPDGTTAKIVQNKVENTITNARYFNSAGQFVGAASSGNEFRDSLSNSPIGTGSNNVWFGTSSRDCENWTSASSGNSGRVGSAGGLSNSWRDSGTNASCSAPKNIYCATQ